MNEETLKIDLYPDQKQLLLECAWHVVINPTTKGDLENKRKKWIRFSRYNLRDVIGELAYCYNRCDSRQLSDRLDELIGHLEYYERYF